MLARLKKNTTLNFVVFILILVICWVLGRVFHFNAETFRKVLAQYPIALSGIIFVVLYVLTTTFIWFGPKDVFRIAGAILFGGYVSTIFVWIAEMVNVVIMFQLSRILGRGFVEKKFRLRSADIDKVKKDSSFFGILALRVNPIIPFRLMDLGFGLSPVSLKKYWMIAFAASLPRIFWLQVILAEIGVGLLQRPKELIEYLIVHSEFIILSACYFAVVIILTIVAIIVKFTKRKV